MGSSPSPAPSPSRSALSSDCSCWIDYIQSRGIASCANSRAASGPGADDILFDKGIFVLPDFLANAGGVTVSYFEQVQNSYNFYWPLAEVHQRLDEKMTRAFQGVYQMYQKEKINMRQAAYLVAVARVAEACKLRGWV